MDKKYCENCLHLRKADQYEAYEDRVRFATCAKYQKDNVFANVSLAFDKAADESCAVARSLTSLCGPDAKSYEEKVF